MIILFFLDFIKIKILCELYKPICKLYALVFLRYISVLKKILSHNNNIFIKFMKITIIMIFFIEQSIKKMIIIMIKYSYI